MDNKAKMRRARKTLERRLDDQEAHYRASAQNQHPDWVVRGDAITIDFDHVALKQLKKHPDWHCHSDSFLKRKKPADFLPYERIARFENTRTPSKFWLYYGKLGARMSNYRLIFYPDDHAGLQYESVSSVLENVTGVKIARLEVALDCGPGTGIDNAFVRRHFISGKCRHNSANSWGSRKGTKFIRTYFKWKIGAQRLELQLNWRFLRKQKIDDLFDIRRLAQLLPVRHIWFVEINEPKLIDHLSSVGLSFGEKLHFLRQLHSLEGDLLEQRALMTEKAGLKNTRRLLKPLPLNEHVFAALRKWSKQWPTQPVTLKVKS